MPSSRQPRDSRSPSGNTPGRGPRPNRDQRSNRDQRADRGGRGTSQRDGSATSGSGPDRRDRTPAGVPMRAAAKKSVPRPDLPQDEEPELPHGVIKEIERAIGKGPRARDIALALSIGAAAIDEERADIALGYLAWAKDQAPRIAAIREAYGIALYHEAQFGEALRELQTYRRLSGKVDQNHVIADCLRATGRQVDLVAERASELVDETDAPEDRRTEAAIVWAAAAMDGGDLASARAILRRFADRYSLSDQDALLRFHYFSGDLAQQDGDLAAAERHFNLVVMKEQDYLDAKQRLQSVMQKS